MKTTEKHEKQIITVTSGDESITLRLSTKRTHFDSEFVCEVEDLARIAAELIGDDAPSEKATQDHRVPVRRNR